MDEHDDLLAVLARAERAEAQYRTLVEQLPAITYIEALDTGVVTSISPQVESILGFTQEEWMGEADLWIERIHPEDRERVIEACVLANQRREPYRAEFRMVARDGRIVWIQDQAELVVGSHGQPLCWQGVMLDITRRYELATQESASSLAREP